MRVPTVYFQPLDIGARMLDEHAQTLIARGDDSTLVPDRGEDAGTLVELSSDLGTMVINTDDEDDNDGSQTMKSKS